MVDGITEGMEKDADSIAKDEQHIRDAFQPLGRIVPKKEQELLNSTTASLRENVKHLREIAARLRKVE